MRIAIPRYNGRISPRFGFAQDVLVADLAGGGDPHSEILSLERCFPEEIPRMLHGKGVQVVLTGGINVHFQDLFRALGIEVIWGLIGTPEEAIHGYVSGQIIPGMGRCPSNKSHRRRGRRGPARI
jgi:predicted Fe-Mo cluster-binding NifX family protein